MADYLVRGVIGNLRAMVAHQGDNDLFIAGFDQASETGAETVSRRTTACYQASGWLRAISVNSWSVKTWEQCSICVATSATSRARVMASSLGTAVLPFRPLARAY